MMALIVLPWLSVLPHVRNRNSLTPEARKPKNKRSKAKKNKRKNRRKGKANRKNEEENGEVKTGRDRWTTAIGNRTQDSVLLILLIHPTLSGYAFSFFNCKFIEEQQGKFELANRTGSYYMKSDYSLKCYDAEWYRVSILAWLVIVLFSFGVPALFAYVLWRKRKNLDDPAMAKQLGVLYKPYRKDLYWFESLQMVFKLGLW